MLRDRYCQLLTDYVDGVLSRRRHKAVLRLLEKSAEARTILQQLQENARKLQGLPHHQLSPEFPAQVLGKIQTLKPPATTVATSGGFPTWVGVGAAAAVLFLVALGSYVFFHAKETDSGNLIGPVAKIAEPKTIDPAIARILQGTAQHYAKDIGTRLTLADLGKKQTRDVLDRELKKTPAVYVDLACHNSIYAVERLSNVLKDNGIKVLLDAKVRAKSGAGQGRAVLVYAENIRPDELSTVLRQLGQKDGQTDRQFDTVLVDALTDRDRHDVAKLLGVKAKDLQPSPRETSELLIGIEKPKAKGKNSGVENPPPPPDRFAVMLAMADGPDPNSAAVKEFLGKRRGLRPGTLQVVVVLHPRA
jgi:hypothetical protein